MFANFDFDVIRRSLGYLFFDGMTFTLTLTGLAALGGLVFAAVRIKAPRPHRRSLC